MAFAWKVLFALASLSFMTQACNDPTVNLISQVSHRFSAPGYPDPYLNAQYECTYSFQAPVNHRIRLTCGFIDIYNSPNCQNSAFLVWKNGDTSTEDYFYFCGYYRNGITTDSNDRYLAAMFANSVPNYYHQYGFLCTVQAYPISAPPTTTTTTTTATIPPPTTENPGSSPCQCGLENRERIVGGTETAQNQYPWMVAISWKNGNFFCGGSLISDEWVLTAAHCLASARAETISLMLGVHDIIDPKSSVVQVDAAQIIRHANYDELTVDNDIALVRLASPIPQPFSNQIRPVCLPYGIDSTTYRHRTATVMGWGVEDFESDMTSNVLQDANVDVFTSDECDFLFENVTGQITPNMFCGYRENKDACRGDSGGPLILNQVGLNFEIGIVSWGLDCAKPGNPGVYTKVINYLGWIEQNTGESFCKPLLQ